MSTASGVAATVTQCASPTQRVLVRQATSTHEWASHRELRIHTGSATATPLEHAYDFGMFWRRVWLVTAVSDDKTARRERVAHTVAELRALLAAARADKTVWHVSYQSRRDLVGDKPSHCRRGHPLSTVGTMANPHDWLPCNCGGHWWIRCRCGEEIVDPTPAYDCQPRKPGH